MRNDPLVRFLLALVLSIFLIPYAHPVKALADQTIYSDSLAQGWQDWTGGWGTQRNLSNASPVHSGSFSIAVTYTGAWQGLLLANAGVSTSGFTSLHFFIHGGSAGGQQIQLYVETASEGQGPVVYLPAPAANQWNEVTLRLSDLGAQDSVITSITWQDCSGQSQAAFYLDDIYLSDDADPDGPVVSEGTLYPRAVIADGISQVIVTARVSDPQGSQDIKNVTLNASALGRGIVQMKDDGLSNDKLPADGVYGVILTVSPGITSGEVAMVVTASDGAGRQSSLQAATLVVLSVPGGTVPSALPQDFGWGTNEWEYDTADDWQVQSGVPWDYVYQYITWDWETWGSSFVQRWVIQAWEKGYIPMITVYMVYGHPAVCSEEGGSCYAQKLANASFVSSYLESLLRMCQEIQAAQNAFAGTDQPVIINIEPDFYGYMQQYTISQGLADTPDSIPAALNIPGYSNTLSGFGKYLVDMIHTQAPGALAAPMASAWATNGNPQVVTAGEAKLSRWPNEPVTLSWQWVVHRQT